MQARYMDPATGRFASEDPGRDANNWYSYASCNPVCCVDRNGRETIPLNLNQLLEISGGELLLALDLLLLSSIANAGVSRGWLVLGAVVAMGGVPLIADGLKDVLVQSAAVGGVISALLNFGINQMLASAKGKGTKILGSMIPNLANVLISIEATAVIDEVYMMTIT